MVKYERKKIKNTKFIEDKWKWNELVTMLFLLIRYSFIKEYYYNEIIFNIKI